MKKRIVRAFMLLAFMAYLVQYAHPLPKRADKTIDLSLLNPLVETEEPTVESNSIESVAIPEPEEWTEEFCDSLEILAQCVEAEAGNQDFKGKQLVADVILNRVDSERFPDTIEEVITQKYHFTTYWDGTMSHIVPSEETYQAVQQELYNDRLDANILFFTADGYNAYCIPGYIYGDHYFGY